MDSCAAGHCPRSSFHMDSLNLVHAAQKARLLIKCLRETRSSVTTESKIQSNSCPFSTHQAYGPRVPTQGCHIRQLGEISAITLNF